MNKWAIILGVFATGILVWNVQQENFDLDTALTMIAPTEEVEAENENKDINVALSGEENFAAIVPSKVNEDFFRNLSKEQEIDQFIVLAENNSRLGRKNIVMSKIASGEFPNAFLDNELVATSTGAFQSSENIEQIELMVDHFFPNAEFNPFLIKDFTTNEEIELFAKLLKDHKTEKTFVLAVVDFSEDPNVSVANFHNELSRTVIDNFDKEGIEQMDVSSGKVVQITLEYSDLIGAKNSKWAGNMVLFNKEKNISDRDLTILAFGDMMLGRQVRILMEAKGHDYIFEGIRGENNRFFKGADIVHANLEGPIHGQGKKGGTAMVFSFNEDVAPLLKKYGFNLLSIANNHAVDQGWQGRETTIAALDKAEIGWCGHPSEADEKSVFYGAIGEKKYAFVCLHDVTFKLDVEQAADLIKKVRSEVDYLVVSIHWGYEYKHTANQSIQVNPAHIFIDAGADFVIGHHPHVVENFEVYKNRLIFYSLGNFVFDQYWSIATQEELAIGLVLDDAKDPEETFKSKVYLFPMKSFNSQSRLMTEEEKKEWFERFIGYGTYSEEMKNMIRSGVIEIGF